MRSAHVMVANWAPTLLEQPVSQAPEVQHVPTGKALAFVHLVSANNANRCVSELLRRCVWKSLVHIFHDLCFA